MRSFAAFAILFLTVAAGEAQVPAGSEFRVNTQTFTFERNGSVAMTSRGDFVVAWSQAGTIPNASYDIFAQRYDAAGNRAGSEFRVNATTSGGQTGTKVAASAHGDFTVIWRTSPSADVSAQRYDATGASIGGEFSIGTLAGTYGHTMAMDQAGNFIVVWDHPTTGNIVARRFSSAGRMLGTEIIVSASTLSQRSPAIAVNRAGSFVVTWDRRSNGQEDVYGQRFDAAGSKSGGEFRVNLTTTADQQLSSVATDAAGNFVVAWGSRYQDGDGDGVVARRFDASGAPLAGEFLVNTYTTNLQRRPIVRAGDAGAFVVVWDSIAQDGGNTGVFGQRFDRDGSRRGGEFQVNTYTTGGQLPTSLATDPAGNFVVVWNSNGQDGSFYGVFGQRFGGLVPMALRADTTGNGVLEPGETADLRPTWRNVTGAVQTFSSTLGAPTGPPGGAPGIPGSSADYGALADGSSAECSPCFTVTIPIAVPRPAVHWDGATVESITPDAQGQEKLWRLHVGGSFADVPRSSGYYRFVETLLHHGVTAGCATAAYCPSSSTSREQMAVFLLVAREGMGYAPQPCGQFPIFADVPSTSPFCRWIEELGRRGVTSGCGSGRYCPTFPVRRDEMAVFVLRTQDPSAAPPPCVPPNLFADLPETSQYCRYVEELAGRGVVTGCGSGIYCPAAPVSREQMAVFLSLTFGLALYGP